MQTALSRDARDILWSSWMPGKFAFSVTSGIVTAAACALIYLVGGDILRFWCMGSLLFLPMAGPEELHGKDRRATEGALGRGADKKCLRAMCVMP